MYHSTPATTDDAGRGVIVVQGIFDPSGERLLELEPVRRYSWPASSVSGQPEGRFVVEVSYVDGGLTTVPFSALVADDSAQGVTTHGFFEVTVPVTGEIASIRITDASGEVTFAQIDSRQIPP